MENSSWTLQGGAIAEPTEAAFLWIADIAFAFQSGVPNSASFAIPVTSIDADGLIPFGAQISIAKDGVQVFLGTLQTPFEGVFLGGNLCHNYRLMGPWWHLENIVYQQAWANRSGGELTSQHRSHLVLCQDAAGNRIATGTQIRDILQWAIGAGAPFQIGSILDGVMAPTRDASDLTCAEAIKTLLRWTPDTVTWFDYATTPPTLHIARRSDLEAVSLPMTNDIATSLRITARHDLQVPSVTLKYEQQNTDDDGSWTTTTADTWPLGANDQAVKALVQTLTLSGSQTARQKQPVVTKSLPAPDAAKETILTWFRGRFPWLRDIGAESLEVVDGSYFSYADSDQVALDGVTPIPIDWDTRALPRELVSGSIAKWMIDAYPSLKVAVLELGTALSYTGNLAAETAEMRAKITQWFQIGNADTNLDNMLYLGASVVATNAITQTYSAITSQEGGEAVPEGIAQQLYVALNTLHYEGSFVTIEQEIGRAVGLGNVLNLTGGRAEWATMNAVVQEVSWAVASGTTTVKFGPPEHLSAQDMVEFLRGARQSKASISAGGRATGEAQGGPTVGGPGHTPNSSSNNPPVGGGSVTLPATAWQILTQTDGSGVTKAICNPASYLFKASMDGTKAEIADIGTAFTPAIGDYAWLELSGDKSGALKAQEFKTGAWPGVFYTTDTSDSGVVFVDSTYLPLAKFVAPNDGTSGVAIAVGPKASPTAMKVVQLCNQHQLLVVRAMSGAVGWSTEAWPGLI